VCCAKRKRQKAQSSSLVVLETVTAVLVSLSRPLEADFCGLGIGLEVSVLNYFSRPPMYLPNPFHMVACLFLPVTHMFIPTSAVVYITISSA